MFASPGLQLERLPQSFRKGPEKFNSEPFRGPARSASFTLPLFTSPVGGHHVMTHARTRERQIWTLILSSYMA
jgi:hypothetical protein